MISQNICSLRKRLGPSGHASDCGIVWGDAIAKKQSHNPPHGTLDPSLFQSKLLWFYEIHLELALKEACSHSWINNAMVLVFCFLFSVRQRFPWLLTKQSIRGKEITVPILFLISTTQPPIQKNLYSLTASK